MYNGIGLQTTRGSGTNGYVVRNLSTLRPEREGGQRRQAASDFGAEPTQRPADKELLEHERKRKVELRCLELRIALEDKDTPEEDIERQIDELRTKLRTELATWPDAFAPSHKEARELRDTHTLLAAKEAENTRMQSALGVSSSYVSGQAFDRDFQEKKRLERIEERARRDEERIRAREQRDEVWRKEEQRQERDQREFQEELQRKKNALPRRVPSPQPRRHPPRDSSESPLTSRNLRYDSRSASPLPRRRRKSSTPPPHRRQDSTPPPRRYRNDSPYRRRDASPPRHRAESPPRYSRSPEDRRPSDSYNPVQRRAPPPGPPPPKPAGM